MAEIVLGVVASGAGLASLALQLSECAVKLKRFYDEVEGAPRSLNRISREIRTFSLLLRSIERRRLEHDVDDTESLADCLELCSECTEEILGSIQTIEMAIRKHRAVGRVFSVSRLREMKEACSDLERAKNTLMLAFQLFDHRTQVKLLDASRDVALQHSLAILKWSEAVAEIYSNARTSRGSEDPKQGIPSEQKHFMENRFVRATQSLEVRNASKLSPANTLAARPRTRHKNKGFRIPSWFSAKIWQISICFFQTRWDFCVQTSNVRDAFSPEVSYYLCGDVDTIRNLYDTHMASPCDIYSGHSTLALAMQSGSPDLVRFLLQCRYPDTFDVLSKALNFGAIKDYYQRDLNFDYLARLLIEHHEMNLESYFENILDNCFRPSMINMISRNLDVRIEDRGVWERLDFLIRVFNNRITPGDLLKFYSATEARELPSDSFSSERYRIVAFVADKIFDRLNSAKVCPVEDSLSEWTSFLQRLIHVGVPLQSGKRSTILRLFVRRGEYTAVNGKPSSSQLLQFWVSLLADARVDLLQYGLLERHFWDEPLRQPQRHAEPAIYITEVTYGDTPQKWSLHFQVQELIPLYRLESLPGGWPRPAHLPRNICWVPSELDREEGGIWTITRVIRIDLKSFVDISTYGDPYDAHFIDVLEGPQDDTGAVALMACRMTARQHVRRRRGSQPAPISRYPHSAGWDIESSSGSALQAVTVADFTIRETIYDNVYKGFVNASKNGRETD